ncbi:MAG: acyltransferase domain-containing protein, partial [Myxococcota bacterium]
GVFFGAWRPDYAAITALSDPKKLTHSATGGDLSIIAGRISYALKTRGPSMVVSTACSSSLVALHLARMSLQRGESELAIVGAVNVIVDPLGTDGMVQLGALSPRGRCSPFDAVSDGYVRSEGAGVVVLRRRDEAIISGDRTYCLISGSATNNDGASNGLTAPNPEAQREVIMAACRDADTEPSVVQYVEAHGTGTLLGDPIEASALGEVYGSARTQPLLIGSAKANFGHAESAAGMLGFLKTTLALHKGLIPANAEFAKPNPNIDFEGLSLQVCAEHRAWPASSDGYRRAGISSFGFGGSNAHLLIRSPWPVLSSPSHEARILSRAGYVFSGQGGHWPGMGRRLADEYPIFRQALLNVDALVRRKVGWSVARALVAGEPLSSVTEHWISTFAVQWSLSELLAAQGIHPLIVVGQSIGEVSAAARAGALTLDEAVHTITALAEQAQTTVGRGAMLVVGAPISHPAVSQLCDKSASVAVAAINGPDAIVLVGPQEELHTLRQSLLEESIFAQFVKDAAPVHAGCLKEEDLKQAFCHLPTGTAQIPFFSSVTGELHTEAIDGAYWAKNLTAPSRFSAAFLNALTEARCFIEVSPHALLTRTMRTQSANMSDTSTVIAPAMQRGADERRVFDAAVHAITSARDSDSAPRHAQGHDPWRLLAISAKSHNALKQRSFNTAEALRRGLDFRSVCYTAGERRSHYEHRRAVVARSATEAIERLSQVSESADGAGTSSASFVFAFSGHGGQWHGMGRTLYATEPVFQTHFDECDAAARKYGQQSLFELLHTSRDDWLQSLETSQPILVAYQISIAATLRYYGGEPHYVVGHSVGELSAAVCCGALSIDQAMRIVCFRSQLFQSLSGPGGMMLVQRPPEIIRDEISRGFGDLSIAVENLRSTVVSGPAAELQRLADRLDKQSVFFRNIRVDFAGHSAILDPHLDRVLDNLSDLEPQPSRIQMWSTVRGQPVDGADLDACYWADNMRQPVLMAPTTQKLLRRNIFDWIEI